MGALVSSNKDECQADLCFPVPIIPSKHEQTDPNHEPATDSSLRDSAAFGPAVVLTFSGSNWDRLGQISPEVQASYPENPDVVAGLQL